MSKSKISYAATEEKTADGLVIYRRRVAGQKGRPALAVKKNDRYIPWKRPLVAKAKKTVAAVAEPVAPAVEPVAVPAAAE